MKLVLAEKPSVAMSLSKVIGANQRGDGYMEGNGYLVSWCVGHLVELSQPEAYDEKYAKWRYDDLPILPEHWQYQVSASTKKQFGILKKLMQRKDVESLICATDAGREGELIFRLVYHQCGCKKPVERLWISSMEDSAIREGFQKLRLGTEYDALYEAALCWELRSAKCPAGSSVKLKAQSESMKEISRQKGAKTMMELNYTKNGDYLIPDIQLSVQEQKPLGKYGRMRRAFLQENNTLLYNHLILTEKLYPHLWEIQETATARMEQMMTELLKANPAPDKKSNQMAWVQHMNMLKAQAEEVILTELINS